MKPKLTETLLHKWLRVPHQLHYEILAAPKKPRATLILVHGIGSSTAMWNEVAKSLPPDTRIIAVDLLGFGHSPQPLWTEYSLTTQARAMHRTLKRLRLKGPLYLAGHSLGSLVVTEYAHRYPRGISQLFLISPPLYTHADGSGNGRLSKSHEQRLRTIYRSLINSPERTQRALKIAKSTYGRINKTEFSNQINITTYLATLDRSIINQDVIRHLESLLIPTTIIRGTRDLLVIKKNIDEIIDTNPRVTHLIVPNGGHNVVGVMRREVIRIISGAVSL
jgi:pimeloyl-ACP methyl ester carboxylesterase